MTAARAFHIQNEWPAGIGNPPDGNPPADLDWDAWLGPAPQRHYNKNRTFYRFRWFYDSSGGQVTNFGVHYIDFIQWALGAEAPVSVTAMGLRAAGMADNREIPDTLEAICSTLAAHWSLFRNSMPLPGRGVSRGANSSCGAPRGLSTFSATATKSCRIPFPRTNSRRTVSPHPRTGRSLSQGCQTPDRAPESPWHFHRRDRSPRAQLSGLRQEPRKVQLRYRDGPPQHQRDVAGQHSAQDTLDVGLGCPGGTLSTSRRGQ